MTLSLFILVCIALFEIKRTGLWLNPLTIFLFEWCIILLCSFLHLHGLYMPQDNTFSLFILGLFMFTIGYFFQNFTISKYRIRKSRITNADVVIEPRYKMLQIMVILCIVYYGLYLVIVLKSVSSFNLWAVQQYLRSNTEIVGNRYIRAIGAFIFGPISFSLPIIAAVDFWFGKRKKDLLVLTVIMTVIQVLATASRMTVLLFIIYLALMGFYKLALAKRNSSVKGKKKTRRWIRLIIVGGLIAFVVLSLSRKLSLIKSLYLQISIPPIMYDIWKMDVDQRGLLGYGEASLNGFFFPVFYVIQKLLGMEQMLPNMQAIYDLINYTDTLWVDVGTEITANAYVSIFWFFYLDAREFGIIVGMFIFGIYCGHAFSKIIKNSNCRNLSLYCMCIITVIFSLVRMQFARANFALAMMFLGLVAFKRVKTRDEVD